MKSYQKSGDQIRVALRCYDEGRLDQAERLADELLSANPKFGLALILKGRIRCALADFQGADMSIKCALILEPSNSSWMWDLAVTYGKSDIWRSAVTWYKRVSLVQPNDAATTAQLVIAMTMCDAHCAAITTLKSFGPTDIWPSSMWHAQGLLFRSMGRSLDALSAFQKSVAISPNDARTILDIAYLNYQLCRMDVFWRLYNFRWKSIQADQIFRTSRLSYRRQSSSTRVFVWAEQGIGDEVMFGALLSEFQKIVGHLIVEMDKRLIPIFRRSLQGNITFHERGTLISDSDFDYHLPIGNLGQYVQPNHIRCLSTGQGYLKADPELVKSVRSRLKSRPNEPIVGISWSSSNPQTGKSRSLPLRDLVRRYSRAGTRLISLQYGSFSEEIAEVRRDLDISVIECSWIDSTNDLDGVAALIEVCDEVITIGNAVAHLAGALGKKTTVIIDKHAPWRWRLPVKQMPWYPSVTLKRL